VPTVAEFLDDVTQRRIRYRVARLGRRFVLSRADKEDLQQDFRLAVLSARAQYDPAKCPLDRFVKMVLNRRYKHHVRQQSHLSQGRSRSPDSVSLDALSRDVECMIPDPRQEADLARVELRHDLDHAFGKMTDIERGVCALLMSGHTQSEAARILGVVPSSVTRAMDRVRKHLADSGLGSRG
jgi:RNA polymerase sigma factor (sigma-70 family)